MKPKATSWQEEDDLRGQVEQRGSKYLLPPATFRLWPSQARPFISDPLARFFWSVLDFQEQHRMHGGTLDGSCWKDTSELTGHPQMGEFSSGLGSWTTPGKKNPKSVKAKFLPTKSPVSLPGACRCHSMVRLGGLPTLQHLTPVPWGRSKGQTQTLAGSPRLQLLVGLVPSARPCLILAKAMAANPGHELRACRMDADAAFQPGAWGNAALPEEDSAQQPQDGLGHILETPWISAGVIEGGCDGRLPCRQLVQE